MQSLWRGVRPGSLRGVATQAPHLELPEATATRNFPHQDVVDDEWLAADVQYDGNEVRAVFSRPISDNELQREREMLNAALRPRAIEDDRGSEGSVESIDADAQMRSAEELRHQDKTIASVLDFGVLLAQRPRFQQTLFEELQDPELRASLQALLSQHGLSISMVPNARGAAAPPRLLGPPSAVHPEEPDASNPLEQLLEGLGRLGESVRVTIARFFRTMRGRISALISKLRRPDGKPGAPEDGGQRTDGHNRGAVFVEAASAIATVLVIAVLLRRTVI